MKIYSTRGNARRAALATFGRDAAEGTHFRVVSVGSGYTVEAMAADPEPNAERPTAEPASNGAEPTLAAPDNPDGEIPAFLRRDEAQRAARAGAVAEGSVDEARADEAAHEPTVPADGPGPGESLDADGSPVRESEAAAGDTGPAVADRPRRTRADSKQARLITMLSSPDGATIGEIATAFDWQPHTVRGALAGALKRRLGIATTSEKVEGRGRVYRIAG